MSRTCAARMAVCAATLAGIAALIPGCSVKKFAVKQVAGALTSGTSSFETDPDVDLVGDALPFSLKLVDSLLAITPQHRGLLVTAAKGYSLYALVYVDSPGEILAEEDFRAGKAMRLRARRLYQRSLGFSLRALELRYRGITEDLRQDPNAAAGRVRGKDVDLLYWAGAALALAISADTSDTAMVLRFREVEAMIERALELDEDWDRGSLHEFRLILEAARPSGGDPEVMDRSFARALELSEGQRAGLYVGYAEAKAIPTQDRELFDEMIGKALAIDPEAHEQYRLLNGVARRRAIWLQSRVDDLFF